MKILIIQQVISILFTVDDKTTHTKLAEEILKSYKSKKNKNTDKNIERSK